MRPVDPTARPAILAIALAFATPPWASPSHAQDQAAPPAADVVLKKTEEWIATRRLISEESAAWQTEKATLADLDEIRKKEIKELDEFIKAAGERVADLDKQKSGLADERNELRKWRGEFEGRFASLETEVRALTPRFPQPLRDKVEDAVLRIESNEADRALQDRVRDLLSILQAAKEFDESFTVASEVREFAGEKREIEVLYLGLAQAWYVDSNGTHSGYGLPSAEGWQWTEDRAIAGPVRQAIEIQTGRATAAFVELPFIPTVIRGAAQ